jgi:hypothetical protein
LLGIKKTGRKLMDDLSKTNLKTLRSQLDELIADTLRNEPSLTYPAAARMFGVSRGWITSVAKRYDIHRPTGRKPKAVK